MLLVYFSKTSNVNRFIKRLNQSYFKEVKGTSDLIVNEDIILVTYTSGMGEIPKEVLSFCNQNPKHIKYVIASGNRNWGKLFAKSGDLIRDYFGARLLYKFELSGTKNDLYNVNVILDKINNNSLE